MTVDPASHYLEEARRQLRGHKRMGEGAMAQTFLSGSHLFNWTRITAGLRAA